MPLLREIGSAVRRRRKEIGLSQGDVAQLAELSRATINALEGGKLKDLGSGRIERLANELGFAVGVVGVRRSMDDSSTLAAARLASVPYASEMPAGVLESSLRTGTIPPGYIAHMRTLLDEAPVAVLADVADQLFREHGDAKDETWARMRLLANVLKCERALWRKPST